MIETMEFCITNVKRFEEISKNARKLIETKYSQEIIAKELLTMLNANNIIES